MDRLALLPYLYVVFFGAHGAIDVVSFLLAGVVYGLRS